MRKFLSRVRSLFEKNKESQISEKVISKEIVDSKPEQKISKEGSLQLEETYEYHLNGQLVIITRVSRPLEKDEFKLHRNVFCGNFSCCVEFFEEEVEFSCINCPQRNRG